MIWETQTDSKLKNKGHDESHIQFHFTFSFMNQTLPLTNWTLKDATIDMLLAVAHVLQYVIRGFEKS